MTTAGRKLMRKQGAINRVHNVQMLVNKFVMYGKILEAVQSFVRQYIILLLSFVYFDPVWVKINVFLCLCQSFDLNV